MALSLSLLGTTKLISILSKSSSTGKREVMARVIGPLAVYPSSANTTWIIGHVKTGRSTNYRFNTKYDALAVVGTVIRDNPDLCWNFDTVDNRDLKFHKAAMVRAIEKLGIIIARG